MNVEFLDHARIANTIQNYLNTMFLYTISYKWEFFIVSFSYTVPTHQQNTSKTPTNFQET